MKARQSRLFVALTTLILVLVSVPAGFAGEFHFNNIGFDLSGSMHVFGDLAGVGNENVDATLIATGTVTAVCENKGGNQAPGRNPVSVEVQQSGQFQTDENGKVFVELVAPDPTSAEFEPSPTPKEAGCPNGKTWIVVDIIDGSTDWTSARVIVLNGAGETELDLLFSCTTIFTDGVATDIKCVEA